MILLKFGKDLDNEEIFLNITVILFMVILFSPRVNALESSEFANENGIAMTEEQVENLRNLGFTDLEIKVMSIEEFNNNKDLKGEVVTNYNKIL